MLNNKLIHSGKKGMKWGVRSSLKKYGPEATVLTGGLKLGKKSNYTDPKAKKLRIEAGKQRTEALFSAGGALATGYLAATSNSPAMKIGFSTASLIMGIQGTIQESKSVARGVEARYQQKNSSN